MNAYFKEYFDYKTLAICIALLIIGLSSIYSATFDINNAYNFHKQLLWAISGFILMLTIAFIPIRTIQRFAFAFYLILVLVLIVVLVVGSRVKGSKSWFGVGGLGGQPSEFAKISTVLAFAAYLSKPNISIANGKHLIIALVIFALPMALVLAQPDLGTMLVFFGTALPLLFWAGASNFVLIAIMVPILIAAAALLGTVSFILAIAAGGVLLFRFRKNYFAIAAVFGLAIIIGLSVQLVYEHMPMYQQKRISTFLNPEADLLGAGYNVVQSKIAIGSGGFFGKGYLHGTQTQLNYIPGAVDRFYFLRPRRRIRFSGIVDSDCFVPFASPSRTSCCGHDTKSIRKPCNDRAAGNFYYSYLRKCRDVDGVDAGHRDTPAVSQLRGLIAGCSDDDGRIDDEFLRAPERVLKKAPRKAPCQSSFCRLTILCCPV